MQKNERDTTESLSKIKLHVAVYHFHFDKVDLVLVSSEKNAAPKKFKKKLGQSEILNV